MIKGCYAITFPNGKWYIGSSQDLKNRHRQHRQAMYHGYHANRHMQNCYNKHRGFKFLSLFDCASEELLDYEQLLIDLLKPELNLSKTAGRTTGLSCSKETRLKISRSRKKWFEGENGEKERKRQGYRRGAKWSESERQNRKVLQELVGRKYKTKPGPKAGYKWSKERHERNTIKYDILGRSGNRPRRSNGTGHASREALQAA